mmetsp:Transcript_146302/g.467425  ORF Transcript_146302/g.467425 Transcript_146302/m.467425 type:complete len:95 (-) Transcript_146302:19-303(-)
MVYSMVGCARATTHAVRYFQPMSAKIAHATCMPWTLTRGAPLLGALEVVGPSPVFVGGGGSADVIESPKPGCEMLIVRAGSAPGDHVQFGSPSS